MAECQKRVMGFLVRDQELAIAIEPGMCSFYYPAPCLSAMWLGAGIFGFLFSGAHVRAVATLFQRLVGFLAYVSGIGTQMLHFALGACHDHCVQGGFEQEYIMGVGSADDERQRDPTRVD